VSELVTFGESMLRLSPPGSERLERTTEFEVQVGGAESNAAIAANRLGADSIWVSKVPRSPLGRRAVNELHEYGLKTSVVWSQEGRQGTYYLERAGAPRGTNVIYDRDDTAVSTLSADELDLEYVRNARMFFTTGITPALSESLRETTMTLLKTAKQAGTTTAFDFNYRRKLWSPEVARETLASLFLGIDILIIAARDARSILDVEGDPRQIAHKLGSVHEFDTVVVTRGADGAVGWHDSVVHEQDAYETDTVSKIGTGDAFTGAFLASRLDGDDVPTALEYAGATAALKRTIPGDVALVTRDEVERVISDDGDGVSR